MDTDKTSKDTTLRGLQRRCERLEARMSLMESKTVLRPKWPVIDSAIVLVDRLPKPLKALFWITLGAVVSELQVRVLNWNTDQIVLIVANDILLYTASYIREQRIRFDATDDLLPKK